MESTEYQGGVGFKCARIIPDGHLAAFGTKDGKIIIWNIVENSIIDTLNKET